MLIRIMKMSSAQLEIQHLEGDLSVHLHTKINPETRKHSENLLGILILHLN